jgi:hypothetical protein
MDKHSSLLQKMFTYRQKSFITLAPGRNTYFSLAKVNHYEDELNEKSCWTNHQDKVVGVEEVHFEKIWP